MIKKLFFLISLALISCSDSIEQLRVSGPVFGTTYSIIYDSDTNFETAFDSLFFEINRSMSTYITTSDISKVNSNIEVVVDHHFESVFLSSKEIYTTTKGQFDPTIGAVVNAWDFGPEGKIESLNGPKIAKLMRSVGMDKVSLNDGVIIKPLATRLDFNAIAKGYGVDVISEFLESQGIQNYLVEIGGEIRSFGQNSVKKSKWVVGVQHPDIEGNQAYVNTLVLENESMATSGTYRKFKIDADGNRYTHIINTTTGYPSRTNILSVSVIAAKCMTADAYATALQAMGVEGIRLFLETRPELKVFIVFVSEDTTFETAVFNGFPLN
jgi:thiamine biosynthesis lipoprotein